VGGSERCFRWQNVRPSSASDPDGDAALVQEDSEESNVFKKTQRERIGNMQGRFTDLLGDIQGALSEHAGNTHAGNIQGI
jgi:hypothetical protein